jgi:hypothetical protein
MITSLKVRDAVAEFVSLIPSMQEPVWYSYLAREMKIRRAARCLPWANAAGVYAFYSGAGELQYIGRALSRVGLASRVPDHLRESCRGNPAWDKVLNDVQARVDVWALIPADSVWAPSLELHLCERFPGIVNRRRS